ncbi:ATP-binding protein [Streptomyces sp. NC-S4]
MRFGLLGTLTVHDEQGVARTPRSPMARALLAALLLEPDRVVSLDRLEALLWEGSPPARARASLHNHLLRLRRSLQDPARIRSGNGGLLAHVAEEELDHVRFVRHLDAARRARSGAHWQRAAQETDAALALWRGAPLAEFPALAHEAAARIVAWQEARLQALELRGEAALHLGTHADLLPELLRLCAELPLRETFHAQLVQVLHRTGRRAEALEVYHRLRRTLVDEMGVDPGPAVRLAYQRALDDDRETPREKRTALTDLPRDAASFTGRAVERDALLAAVRGAAETGADAVGIYAVDGMPGSGKTAFAVHVAHRLGDAYPDGQIFLPLQAHTPGTPAVDPKDALTSLLLTLGENPRDIPDDLAARAGLWRRRLAGRRFLVLLDDAHSSAQVEPLLPGTADSLVLVTSRTRLEGLRDAVPVTLGVLTPDEAVRLVVATAARSDITADDPAVAALAALCGCLPLALQLVAARLRHRPAWTAADVVQDLGAARGRLDALVSESASVAAAFEVSYEGLPRAAQGLFRRLGLLIGDDVDAHGAAALHGVPPERTRALLRDLENRHLLEERVRGRYRMHDLVREYARTLAAADGARESKAARERLLDHYLHTAVDADRRLARYGEAESVPRTQRPASVPGFRDGEEAAAWLRTEQANLGAAVEYAARHGHTVHAIHLPAAMTEHLRRSGHWNEALGLQRTALDVAVAADDVAGQAMAHRNIATVESLLGRYGQAEAGLLRALDLFRAVGDRHREGIVLQHLAKVQRITGRTGEAADTLREALDRFVGVGDGRGQAAVWVDMGQLHQFTGQYPQAIAGLEKALALLRPLGEVLGQANALSTLGNVHRAMGRYPEAEARHRESLVLYRRLGSLLGQTNALTDLGDVQRLTGAYDEAETGLREALRLARAVGSRIATAEALTYLGFIQLRRGRLAEAEADLREALALCEALGSALGLAHVRQHLAEVECAAGALPEALGEALTSLDLFRRAENREGETGTLNVLGAVQLAMGSPDEALESHRRALDLAREIRAPFGEARALEGVGSALARLGRADEGREFLGRALAIDQRLGVPDAARVRSALAGEPARRGGGADEYVAPAGQLPGPQEP